MLVRNLNNGADCLDNRIVQRRIQSIGAANERFCRLFHFGRVRYRCFDQLDAMLLKRFLRMSGHNDSIRLALVNHDANRFYFLEVLSNEIHQLDDGFRVRVRCPGDISAWLLQVINQFGIQWIGNTSEQNWRVLNLTYKSLSWRGSNPKDEIVFLSGNFLCNR
ncbi:hypothetical protein D3C77_570940 [compost metagenome]